MQTLNLNNAEFLPHVCEFVNEGHKVTILARGNSMRPFIESDRDEVVLTRATQYNVGDVVLAEIQPGHYVLHRIDKIQNEHVVLRGDGNVGNTESCSINDLRAVVCQIKRKGKVWNLQTSKVWKCYSYIWTRTIPLRRLFLALYRLLWLGQIPDRMKRLK